MLCTDGPQATGLVAKITYNIKLKLIIGVQLIKGMEVNSGGLVVAFWTAALEGKVTGVWWFKISFKMVPKVMQ